MSVRMDLGGGTTCRPSTFGASEMKQELESECQAELETLPLKQEAEIDITPGPELLMGGKIEPFSESELENDSVHVAISGVFTMRVNSGQKSSRNSDGKSNLNPPIKQITKDNLRLHTNINKGVKLFTCKICNYRTWKKLNFAMHRASHLPKKRVYRSRKGHSATAKPMQTRDQSDLHTAARNLREKPFEYLQCNLQASNMDTLNACEITHSEEKQFFCHMCNYRSSWRQNLTKHMQNHTANLTTIPSDSSRQGSQANNDSDMEKEMKNDLEWKPTAKTKNLKEKPFKCLECDYQGSHQNLLNSHLRKHTGEKPFVCQICGYRSSWKGNLNKHIVMHTELFADSQQDDKGNDDSCIETHTEIKPEQNEQVVQETSYICEVCGYQTSWKRNLTKHMTTHTVGKPVCGVSDYQINQQAANINTPHKEEKPLHEPFACDLCDYNSKYKCNLKLHKRRHHIKQGDSLNEPDLDQPIQPFHKSERSYKCDGCDFKTIHKQSLVAHMRVHTGEQPFKCDFCSYRTSWKCNLRKHMNSRHSQDVICDSKARYERPVTAHKRTNSREKHSADRDESSRSRNNFSLEHTRFYKGDELFACDVCGYVSKYKWNLRLHKRKHHNQPVHDEVGRLIKSANMEFTAGTSEHQRCSVCFKKESQVYKFCCESCRWFWDYWKQKDSKPPNCPGHETEADAVDCPGCRWGRYNVAFLEWERGHGIIKNTSDVGLDDFECTDKMEGHSCNQMKIECINEPAKPQLDQPMQPLHEELDQLIELACDNKDNQSSNDSTLGNQLQLHVGDKSFGCDLCEYKSKYKWNLKPHKEKCHSKPVHPVVEPNLDPPIQPLHEELDQLIELAREGKGNQANSSSTPTTTTYQPQPRVEDEIFACDLCDYKSKYKWNVKQHNGKCHKKPINDNQEKPDSLNKMASIECPAVTFKRHPCSVCFKTGSKVYKFRCESCRWFWNYWKQKASKPPDCPGHETEGEALDCPGCRWGRYNVASLEWEKNHTKIEDTRHLGNFESTGKMERHVSSSCEIQCMSGPFGPQLDHPIQPLHGKMNGLERIESVLENNSQFHAENGPFSCDLCDYKSRQSWNLKLHKKRLHNSRQCLVCFKSESKVFKSRCMACRAFWSYWKRACKPPDCPGHTKEGEDVDCSGCRWGRYEMVLLTEESKGPNEPSLDQPIQLLQDKVNIKIEPVSEPPHEDVAHPAQISKYPICPICFKSEAQVFKFRCEKCRWFWTSMAKGLSKPPECPGHGSAVEDLDCPGCRRRRYEVAFLNANPGEPLRVPPMTKQGQKLMDHLKAGISSSTSPDDTSIKEDTFLNTNPGELHREPPVTEPGQELMDFCKPGDVN